MEFHFATIWETIADTFGDRDAVIHGDKRFTWAQNDERAAHGRNLRRRALAPTRRSALHVQRQRVPESHYAAFKMRGVPININYRYMDEELWYLLDNADAEAIVFHSSLGDRVERVRERLPKLKLLIEVDDGGAGQVPVARRYEEAMANSSPMARITRSEDDIYMLYTGGTTGMPKGVMYDMGGITRAFAALGFPLLGLAVPTEATGVAPMVKGVIDAGAGSHAVAPLMHGTGMRLGQIPQLGGATVTLQSRSLDRRTVEHRRGRGCHNLTIVGDAFSKPILRAMTQRPPVRPPTCRS